jgi:hypothetical protein
MSLIKARTAPVKPLGGIGRDGSTIGRQGGGERVRDPGRDLPFGQRAGDHGQVGGVGDVPIVVNGRAVHQRVLDHRFVVQSHKAVVVESGGVMVGLAYDGGEGVVLVGRADRQAAFVPLKLRNRPEGPGRAQAQESVYKGSFSHYSIRDTWNNPNCQGLLGAPWNVNDRKSWDGWTARA